MLELNDNRRINTYSYAGTYTGSIDMRRDTYDFDKATAAIRESYPMLGKTNLLESIIVSGQTLYFAIIDLDDASWKYFLSKNKESIPEDELLLRISSDIRPELDFGTGISQVYARSSLIQSIYAYATDMTSNRGPVTIIDFTKGRSIIIQCPLGNRFEFRLNKKETEAYLSTL